MKPLTLAQIRQAAAAKPLTVVPSDAPWIEAIHIDSRAKEPRPWLFVALRGERFDGHDFLAQAAAHGAVAALVERVPQGVLPGLHLLLATDTYLAMGKLAKAVRQQMRARVIAVAGSNGKTGTKLLVHAALRTKLRGGISPKSFNNRVGVPITIFPADAAQDYLVLEMGTNHPGEIRTLTEMATPDVAVITNAGAEHLEGLGDLAGVRRENASVTFGLNPKGLLVVNGDDRELVTATGDYRGQKLKFGFDPSNDLFAGDVRCDEEGVRFKLNGRREVWVPLLGAHTACNALAAIAVARKLGVTEEQAVEGLAHADGPEMRLELRRHGEISVLNDAYNANPTSMRAALQTLAALKPQGRRIAVLGDMLELGDASEQYHGELGTFAATEGKLDLLACVGARSAAISDAAEAAGMPARQILHCTDAAATAAILPAMLRSGDLVLLKASRGIGLEVVARAIENQRTALAKVS